MAELRTSAVPSGNLSSLGSARSTALLVVDDERRLIEANPAACSLLGLSNDELIGRPLDSLLAESMRDRLDNVWRAFRDNGGHAGPFELAAGRGTAERVDIGVTSRVPPGRHLVILTGSKVGVPQASAKTRPPADGIWRTPTSREREILAMLATGATDGQIARRLALSPATVQTHVRNAKAKLGARTRAQAVALALRRGVITLN
jgi:DNA-binding CsgD family transcriptional regulator